MKQIKKSAFTLIELIVVITVIGILSTIGIATFSSFKEKARETKIFSFAENVSHELKRQSIINASSPIGIWKFNESSGAPQDSSGNENHLAIFSPVPVYEESNNIFQGSHFLRFTGGRVEHLSLAEELVPGEFTVSYYFQMPTATSTGYPLYFSTDAGQITTLTNQYGFQIIPFGVDLDNTIVPGKWHHVIFTYKNSILKVYFDGELASEVTHALPGLSTINWIRSGHGGGGSDIYLDNLEIYPFAVEPNF